MSLWTPPQIKVESTTRPAYGTDDHDRPVGEISGLYLLAVMQALQQAVASQVRTEHPDASEDMSALAASQAGEAWLNLLNQSCAAAPQPLTASILQSDRYRFSTEFCFLAIHYADLLSEAPRFTERLAQTLLDGIMGPATHLLPLRMAYQRAVTLLRQEGAAELRPVSIEWRAAEIEWCAATELARLPQEYHQEYLVSLGTVYSRFFQQLPVHLKGDRPADFGELHSMLEGAASFRWTFRWTSALDLFGRVTLIGLILTVILALIALVGGPAWGWVSWIALLPVTALWLWARQQNQIRRSVSDLATGPSYVPAAAAPSEGYVPSENAQTLEHQVKNLTALRDITLAMSTTLDRKALLDNIIEVATTVMRFDRAIVLITDPQRKALTFGASSHPAPTPEAQFRMEQLEIPLSGSADLSLVLDWRQGQSVHVMDAQSLYTKNHGWLFAVMEMDRFLSVPLVIGNNLLGVILVDNHFTHDPITSEEQSLLETLGANISIALENARLYHLTDEQLNRHVQQLDMMRQIDRELMEALSWDRVLNMTLDWALRLTGAHAAALALHNPEAGELRIVATYGLDATERALDGTIISAAEGTMGRVVRTGQPVSVADVLLDPETERFSTRTQSMLAVPVRRRNRVTAVLCLESPRKNGFSPEHLDFAQQIANRASIALDNARLFLETQQERQKLSSILEKTTDIVIVVGFDQRLILLNDAALAAFRLKPQDAIPGTPFLQLFAYTPLEKVARNLELEDWHPVVEDIVLDGTRYFHANIVPNEQVGWVILMHDITPFKETEQLKNELIATVSHDLKNPLSVINGYIELLGMYGTLDEREQEFMLMIRRSIRTMRQLIDDLLDLAHIDTGLDLHLEPINIYPILEDSVVGQKNLAEEKKQSVLIDAPQDLPLIAGDKRRLRQILVNLVSNAIKYTPPEGRIVVSAQLLKDAIMISIADNGLGIGPEDQTQIFERFYRVRRPETDSIEGTGLGLAIVKSLVEAHGGTIGLNSHLGEGSTFFFTIPLAQEDSSPTETLAQPAEEAG